eukprot:gnl/MRDRNA2_/MRDRNA2_103834_c0_seq1.p1 gnl/MRDRNA2_/MRDRNA2_103834_c0~~gnl/MRDRNA2_/MRDRNA2_103834_c0_seq1.p1  ORF type:complete len:581 (-),score=99.77 gnl/MRDRNA2_/MRDRNA2_103834_c0_seq1:113-1813(-)
MRPKTLGTPHVVAKSGKMPATQNPGTPRVATKAGSQHVAQKSATPGAEVRSSDSYLKQTLAVPGKHVPPRLRPQTAWLNANLQVSPEGLTPTEVALRKARQSLGKPDVYTGPIKPPRPGVIPVKWVPVAGDAGCARPSSAPNTATLSRQANNKVEQSLLDTEPTALSARCLSLELRSEYEIQEAIRRLQNEVERLQFEAQRQEGRARKWKDRFTQKEAEFQTLVNRISEGGTEKLLNYLQNEKPLIERVDVSVQVTSEQASEEAHFASPRTSLKQQSHNRHASKYLSNASRHDMSRYSSNRSGSSNDSEHRHGLQDALGLEATSSRSSTKRSDGKSNRKLLHSKTWAASEEEQAPLGPLKDYKEVHRLLEKCGNSGTSEGAILIESLGRMQEQRGDLQDALESYAAAHQARENSGTLSTRPGASLMWQMGNIQEQFEATKDALSSYNHALITLESLNELETELGLTVLKSLGALHYHELGQVPNALNFIREEKRILEKMGRISFDDGIQCLNFLGTLYQEVGDKAGAIECLMEEHRIREEIGMMYTPEGAACKEQLSALGVDMTSY